MQSQPQALEAAPESVKSRFLSLEYLDMPGFTYIKSKPGSLEDLQEFTAIVFHALNIGIFSRRESDNYIGGEYFVGKALGIKVKVALADDSEFSDYQFWMTFSTDEVWIEDQGIFENLADVVARYLTLKDYQVARDPSSGRIGAPKIIYSRKIGGTASTHDQVEVKQVP